MPQAKELYYFDSNKINCHNKLRSETKIDWHVWTNNWDRHINYSILGMIFAVTYLLYKVVLGDGFDKEKCLHAFSTKCWRVNSSASRLMMRKVQKRAAKNKSAKLLKELALFTVSRPKSKKEGWWTEIDPRAVPVLPKAYHSHLLLLQLQSAGDETNMDL